MRKLLPWLVAPAYICGLTAATWSLGQRGLEPLPAFGITSSVGFATLLLLERALPHRPEWNRPDGQMANDVGHTIVGTMGGARLGGVINEALFGGLTALLVLRFGGPAAGLWPAHWPWAAQLALICLVADLGRWVQHRLHHAVPLLWRFHVLHHDIEKLSAFKNSRSHLVERVLQAICMFGPLTLLGAPADLIYWFMVPNSFLGMLDHSNVDARLGPLELVVNGPATHRLHHSREQREGNSNFGSALVVWDMLFRTWVNPLRHPGVRTLGVDAPGPKGFWSQLISPFTGSLPGPEPRSTQRRP